MTEKSQSLFAIYDNDELIELANELKTKSIWTYSPLRKLSKALYGNDEESSLMTFGVPLADELAKRLTRADDKLTLQSDNFYESYNDYRNTKLLLEKEEFKVLHLFEDTRGDWGDDGGFMVVIAEKNEKIYLHILGINYNSPVKSHNLDEEAVLTIGGFPDFIICETVEDAQGIVNKFVSILDYFLTLKDEDDFYGESAEEFMDELNDDTHNAASEIAFISSRINSDTPMETLSEFLYVCFFPYSEFADNGDRNGLLTLTETNFEQCTT